MATTNYPFPSDLDHPKKKEEKSWGAKVAKAIWSNNEYYGPSLFHKDKDAYLTYLKYFRGEQDTDRYKPSVGINPRDAKSTFVAGIRWQAKNFCTKRINVVVSKLFNRKYDPIATAIDPLAIDRKEDYKAKVKTFMEYQEWLLDVEKMTKVNMMPQGMTLEELPLNDEDLKIHMDNNHKYNDEIDLELGIQYHVDKNDFDVIKKSFDFDFVALGVGGVDVNMDSNAMPKIKWLEPAKIITPRSDRPDFSDAKYKAYYDDYTVSDFRLLHGGEIDEETEKRVIEEHAKKGNDYLYDDAHSNEYTDKHDVDKIRIMKFEYKSANQVVFLEKADKGGNNRFHEKDYDYYKTLTEQEKFRERYKSERKLHRKTVPCIYEGYWVIGSDVVFGYKKKNNQTGKIGIKVFAPNMRDNQTMSLIKQMIPSLDLLETYDKKIQQIVASAIPKGVQIDLEALKAATFEMGGKDMSEMDLLEMYFQKGIIIMSPGEKYGNGNGYKPITELENGMSKDVVNYISLIQQELENLDEIIGVNKVSAASNLHQDTGKAVAQQMDLSTEVALDYLYQADRLMTLMIYDELADLHIQSVKYNDASVYTQIFGGSSVQRMKESFSRHKYGISIEARPTQQEWAMFYQDLKEHRMNGFIDPEDEIMIKRANNLKQAQAYMRVVMKRKRKEAQESKMQDVQANAQAQQQSNEIAHQKAVELEQIKSQSVLAKEAESRKTEALKHKWKMEQLQLQGEIERRNKLQFIDKEGDEKLEGIALKGNYDLKKEKEKPSPTSS